MMTDITNLGMYGSCLALLLVCVYSFQSKCRVSEDRRKPTTVGKGSARFLVKAIGHRGSRQEGLPENTIIAFKDAVAAGADCVELDVWLSRDGQVVVHHDKCFKRMAKTDPSSSPFDAKKIYETDYADMPSIAAMHMPAQQQLQLQQQIEGKQLCGSYPFHECCQIPLLEHVLQAIPKHVTIVVEVKQDSDELIEKVLLLVDRFDRRHTMFWFSLDEKVNAALRRAADGSIPTITSVPAMLRVLALHYCGLLPFVTIPDAVFGVTVEEITLEQIRSESSVAFLPSWIHYLLSLLFQGKPPHLMIAPSLFRHLRSRGVPVWFLGVNTVDELLLADKAGATAVLTDRIRWLVREMKDRDIRLATIS